MSTGKMVSLIKALGGTSADLPFGTEVSYTSILPQETVTVTATEGTSALYVDLAGLVHIEVGKKYRVIFDGVEYTCEAFAYDAWGAVCVGNGKLIGATVSNNEPFCISRFASYAANINVAKEGTHTVSVEEIVEEVTPIPNEYLTGEAPAPYMQLVTDGEGQAKWEQRLAWKEMQNVEVAPEQTVTTDSADGKISAEISPIAFKVGNTYTVIWDGASYECVAREYDGYIMIGNNAIYPFDNDDATDTGEPFAIESGIEGYVFTAEEGTYTFSITAELLTAIPIPDEYISFVTPNQPTTVLTWDGSATGLQYVDQTSYTLYGPFATTISAKDFVGGYVVYGSNSEKKGFTANMLAADGKAIAIPYYSEGSYFAVVVDEDGAFTVTDNNGNSTELSAGIWLVYGSGQFVEEVVVPRTFIKEEYLPQPIVFTASADGTSVTCNKTHEEVCATMLVNPKQDVWLEMTIDYDEPYNIRAVFTAIPGENEAEFVFLIAYSGTLSSVAVRATNDGVFTIESTQLISQS